MTRKKLKYPMWPFDLSTSFEPRAVNVLHSNLMPHFWPVPLIWYKKYKIFGGWVHKKNIAEQALAYIIWPSSTAYQTCSHACTWEKYKGFVHVRTASMLLHRCTVHVPYVRTFVIRPCRQYTYTSQMAAVRRCPIVTPPPFFFFSIASSRVLLRVTLLFGVSA
jgi:hypothetical protein